VDELEELHTTRERLASLLISERRRLERALHDGVQQDLTALAVELQLATGGRLDELRRDVHAALDRVRALADEIYPSLLDAGGLAAALPGVARRAGVRLRLDTAPGARGTPAAEAALVFACRSVFEAAAADTEVTVSVQAAEGRLQVELTPVDAVPPLAVDLVEGTGGNVEADAGRLVFRI
jgi:signal transduction histidine kinase